MRPALGRERAGHHAGSVLVVDDEADILTVASRALREDGFEVRTFPEATSALEAMEAADGEVDVVLTDIHMPDMTGLQLLATVRERWPTIVVVLMTGRADVSSAVEAVRLGAYDYLLKPLDAVETLLPAAKRAVEYKRLVERNRFLQRQLDVSERVSGMVGSSKPMREVLELIANVAPTDATVLILGETGTGKELVARAIHEQSRRSGKAFVDVNCAALTESVLESELFGHVRGAFTGAVAGRRGLFEEATGGTLFLDEIGDLSSATQARLLRVLQEGMVRPVGSNESRQVDVRVVAATNRDLVREVQENRFREDLFYRLNVISIELPPLRERREDLAPLIHHFVQKQSARLGRQVGGVDSRALELLTSHSWPGNVRELENAIERAIIVSRADTISAAELPASIRPQAEASAAAAPWEPDEVPPLSDARAVFERHYVQHALKVAGGNITEAATLANIDRSNFRRLMRRLKLERDGGEDS